MWVLRFGWCSHETGVDVALVTVVTMCDLREVGLVIFEIMHCWRGCCGLVVCYDDAGVEGVLVYGWFKRWAFADVSDDALVMGEKTCSRRRVDVDVGVCFPVMIMRELTLRWFIVVARLDSWEDGFVILGMAYWLPNICSSDSWIPKGWREFIARLWRVGWTILAIPGNKEALMSCVFYDAVPAVPFAIRLNRSLVFYDFLFPLYLT